MIRPHDHILFQGDSITDAFRKPGEVGISYQMGSGWAMIVAARLLAERPCDGLRFENRGVSGNGLTQMETRWEVDCLALRPNILNLLVGVNETMLLQKGAEGLPVAEFEVRYRRLLQRTRQALPVVRLVLCEPFLLPFPGYANAGPKRQFNLPAITESHLADIRLRQTTVRRLAAECDAVFVPLQDRLEQAAAATGTEHWLFDGVHPNAAGQWLIAKTWLEQVARA